MPAPSTTLLVEGNFPDLVNELVEYVDNLKKNQNQNNEESAPSTLKSDVEGPLGQYAQAEEAGDQAKVLNAREDVLKVIVPAASNVLNTAPEREFVAAYNLVIHLIQPSESVSTHLQPLCASVTRDASSPTKAGLALTVLSTVFNTLATDDSIRYPVFNAILDVISRSSASGSFDALRPQLKHLESWLSSWNTPAPQARKLYLRIASIATEAGENEDAYEFLIRALRTIPSEEVSSKEARDLSIDALKAALVSSTHFDFEDLTSLDSVQALRNSDDSAASTFFELLEIFTSQLLEDYVAFKSEHNSFVSEQSLDDAALTRKMRLLTLASIASSTGQSRSLPYSNIASSLQIDADDVEMWVIDVIRAGLVEGKLSQQKQMFLIHRSTYRVFGDQQWREVAGRLDMWRSSLIGVLGVIRQEKAGLIAQKERELREVEAKVNGSGGGYRRNQQREAIDVGLD